MLILYRKLTEHKKWSLVADRNTLVHPTTHLIYNSAAWSWHYTRTNNAKLETSFPGAQTVQAKKQQTNNVPIQNWQVGPVVHLSANDIWVWACTNWLLAHENQAHEQKPVQCQWATYIYYEMFWYWTQSSNIWQDMAWYLFRSKNCNLNSYTGLQIL
jgi:hypothetical protein